MTILSPRIKDVLVRQGRQFWFGQKGIRTFYRRRRMQIVKTAVVLIAISFSSFPMMAQASSDQVQAYLDQGEAYGRQGQFDKAIAEINKAIELDPKNANAFNDRGLALWLKGDMNPALADYNKAIELNPTFATAYNNRGLLYGKGQGEMDLAIADFSKAIELDPKLVDAYLSRGMAYSFKQEFDKSIEDYGKVIEIDPNAGDAYFNQAVVYFYKGEYAEAWKNVHYLQSIRGKVPAEFIKDLSSKMSEPQRSMPLREKGLVVHFGPKTVVAGISGRFMYSVGLNGEKKSVDLPEDLVEAFLKQDKIVQENGIWIVITNPAAYSAEENEMVNTLGSLCKQKNIVLFKARGMDLPGGWKRIN